MSGVETTYPTAWRTFGTEARRPRHPPFDSPPQQNLWACFGSGRFPRLCKRASFATPGVRKPYDFLVTSSGVANFPGAILEG
jgi:hypothetical protein